MLLSAVLAVALGAACASDDASTDAGEPVTSNGASVASSSIVSGPNGLWVASPDDELVVLVDPESLAVTRSVPVRGGPRHVALAASGDLLVTRRYATGVARIPAGTDQETKLDLPCGATWGVVISGQTAFVTCPGEGRLVSLDLASGAAVVVAGDLQTPTGLALQGDRLAVAESHGGAIRVFDVAAAPKVAESITVETAAQRTATQLDSVAPGPGDAFVAVYQQVDNASGAVGGFGSLQDGKPRIEPRVHARCGGTYADYSGGLGAFAGPTAIVWAEATGTLWVLNAFSHDLAVLRCGVGTPPELVARAWVGQGACGLVVDASGKSAWVDAAFDHSVSRVTLTDAILQGAAAVELDAQTVARQLGPSRFTEEERRGRNVFFSAVNTQLTPSGIVACASCHHDGEADGLIWALETANLPKQARRTKPVWTAKERLMPLLWDGSATDVEALIDTKIRELLGGPATTVDRTPLAKWMEALPAPVAPTVADSDAIARGRAIFERAEVACTTCHSGSFGTDQKTHSVLSAGAASVASPAAVDTPPLRGARARAPFGHDGRAADISALFSVHNAGDTHGKTSGLSALELADLVAYVESL